MEDDSAREVESEKRVVDEADADKYFFAKFLTSPDLLDLELADTNFRRQILFQLVIILKHLMQASQASKPPQTTTPTSAATPTPQPALLVPNAKSQSQAPKQPTPTPTPAPASAPAPGLQQRRKRQLLGEVALSADDETWVKRMLSNCFDEWRATGAGSIRSLIARDEHWVDWKNKFCPAFERRDFDPKADEEVARKTREDMIFRPLDVWRNPLGSASLTAVWDSKFNGPEDLEDVTKPPTMQKFENMNKSINLQIQRAEAAIAAEQAMHNPVPQPTPSEPTTEQEDTSTPKPIAAKLAVPSAGKPGGVPSRPSTPVPGAAPGQSASIIARPNDEELPRAPKPAPRLTPKQRLLEEHQLTKTKICWQALRAASLLGHGRVFSQIGIGSVESLIQEIEKDKKKYEDERAKRLAAKADEAAKAAASTPIPTPSEEKKEMEVDA
ncbi:THO complex subunit 1 [Ceratobasidium sp. AG-Ba]|nr:THO complex subunit 1 [Ceratobasidium sp. AG-Ba]